MKEVNILIEFFDFIIFDFDFIYIRTKKESNNFNRKKLQLFNKEITQDRDLWKRIVCLLLNYLGTGKR
jgi:hypothetical protein